SALRCHSRRSGPFQLMEGLSPFRRLQDGQSACPLMESVAPPRDQGVMWSPCQPGSSSRSQWDQRPPEAVYVSPRSAVLKRRRVERLASPREGGVESATSATPTGCLATAPALAEARGFFASFAVDVVGTLLLRGGWLVITRESGACAWLSRLSNV